MILKCCTLEKTVHLSSLFHRVLVLPALTTQTRNAARKGTREKREKKKVKAEVEKIGFIPHNQRNREKFLASRPKRKFDDSWKQVPLDNVYPQRFYRWRVYDFQEAVQCHRETHHPQMYNKPNEKLHVSVELNMEGEKKTRFVDNFSRIAPMPHKFDHGEERPIIAFTKIPEMQEEARLAGAHLSGGTDLIKEIQNGSVALADFRFIVAHPAILSELVVLRGVMKKRFPNIKAGTLDTDVSAMVTKFMNGISYMAVKDEYEKDFGIIETVIGTLDMDPAHLEENFASLVRDVLSAKPKRSGTFITRTYLWSPPSTEKLKVDFNLYAQKETARTEEKEEDENIEEAVAAN